MSGGVFGRGSKPPPIGLWENCRLLEFGPELLGLFRMKLAVGMLFGLL